MSHSIITWDHGIHIKVVVVSLVASIIVAAIASAGHLQESSKPILRASVGIHVAGGL